MKVIHTLVSKVVLTKSGMRTGLATLHVKLPNDVDIQRLSWIQERQQKVGGADLPCIMLAGEATREVTHAMYVTEHADGNLCLLTHCTCGWESLAEGFAPGPWFAHAHPGVAP